MFPYAAGIPVVNASIPSLGDQNPLAAYSILQGKYSVENLTAVPSVNSALGVLTTEDFVVTVSQDGEGNLQAKGLLEGNVADVLDVKEACNGYVYKLNKMLLPATNANAVSLDSSPTDIAANFENALQDCVVSLPEAIAGIPNTDQWQSILNSTGLISPLK